jgi:hypothetical protein
MPTGLKGYQQLSSGCVARPSERQSRPLGAATQPVMIELSRERHHAPWRVERALALWDFWYSCWSLTLCVDGWVQVVRERGHHDRWHRVGPSHSRGTILVWPRLSAPRLVEEGRMGDGTRVGTGSEKIKGLVATKISLDAPEP